MKSKALIALLFSVLILCLAVTGCRKKNNDNDVSSAPVNISSEITAADGSVDTPEVESDTVSTSSSNTSSGKEESLWDKIVDWVTGGDKNDAVSSDNAASGSSQQGSSSDSESSNAVSSDNTTDNTPSESEPNDTGSTDEVVSGGNGSENSSSSSEESSSSSDSSDSNSGNTITFKPSENLIPGEY